MKHKMTKCNFCPMSSPSGKCFYACQTTREDDCKKAINKMAKALQKQNKK